VRVILIGHGRFDQIVNAGAMRTLGRMAWNMHEIDDPLRRAHWPANRHGAPWLMLRTRSRYEKILVSRIHAREATAFLPLAKVHRRYAGLDVMVELPLFSNFVFFQGDRSHLKDPDLAHCIASVEEVPDQDRLRAELKSIAIAIDNAIELQPHPYLQTKTDVEVTTGPLAHTRAVVPDIATPRPLLLQITAAQLAFRVAEEFDVKPIGSGNE
jgi:hypothetical protein